jgi:hypothetical protein
MSDDADRKTNPKYRRVLMVIAVAIILYPLSIGAVAFLLGAGAFSGQILSLSRGPKTARPQGNVG